MICHLNDGIEMRFSREDEGLRYKNSIHCWVKRTEVKYAIRSDYLAKQP